jgi:hypothetical protein
VPLSLPQSRKLVEASEVLMPFIFGVLSLIVLYIIFYGVWSKSWNPADLFTG